MLGGSLTVKLLCLLKQNLKIIICRPLNKVSTIDSKLTFSSEMLKLMTLYSQPLTCRTTFGSGI